MPEDASPTNNQQPLEERLRLIEELLRMQTARLHAIEDWLGIDFKPPRPGEPPRRADERPRQVPAHDAAAGNTTTRQPTTPHEPPPATPHGPAQNTSPRPEQPRDEPRFTGRPFGHPRPGSAGGTASAGAGRGPSAGAGVLFSRSSAKGRADAPGFDLESLIGGSWLLWAGILALTFGVAFFLKYAFENEWIGPAGRVLLGAAAGCAILFAGERLRLRGLRYYAYVLTGGGILILYLSVYAAYAFYSLVGQPAAFLLMVGVTAAAVLLSARYDALPIAVLALVGGFLTPALLSTGQDNEVGLFTYVAMLDAGVLTLAYFKRWRALNYMSFGATLLMFLGWMVIHYAPEKLWPTVFFLSLFFLLYSALTLVYNVLRQRPADWLDILLVSTNAAFFFGLAYKLLDDAGHHFWLGSFALAVSAFYLLFYYATRRLHRADRLLVYSLLGASVTFLTTAVAVQLEQQWVTIAWATEAAVLVWVGLRSGESAPRHSAVVVFAVAVMHWLSHDVQEFASRAGEAFTPFFNARAASCAALVASCAVVVRLYRGAPAGVEEGERRGVTNAALLAANALALTLLTLDTSDYFQHLKALVPAEATPGVRRLENWRLLALAFVWTLYGAAAFAVGARRGRAGVRYGGLALVLFAVVLWVLPGLQYSDDAWHAPVLNPTFAGFALSVAALAFVVWLYDRARAVDEVERRLARVVAAFANLLAVAGLSGEAYGHFEARLRAAQLAGLDTRELRLAQQLSLSVIWAVYGGAMLLYGHLRGRALLRWVALALLGMTTFKVFLVDLASLDRIYKVVSFLLLGLVLLAVSYLYQKNRRRAPEEEDEGEREVGGALNDAP